MIKLKYNLLLLVALLVVNSCYKDKGNYTYEAVNSITIENIPDQINVLGNIDTLIIAPKITSSLEGEITADNENYTFIYAESGALEYGEMKYVALDSTYAKDLNYFVKLEPKIYNLNYIVTDKRTGIQTIKPFKLNVTSAVTEGWMVLCNEGPTQRVRMDMISVISQNRTAIAYDLAASLGLAELTKAYKMSYLYKNFATAEINVITEEDGAYDLLQTNLRSYPTSNMKNEFGDKTSNGKPQNMRRAGSYFVVVDGDNNVYSQMYSIAGPIFQFPVNTTKANRIPEFKVSKHFVSDPRTSGASNTMLAYDITNKRFVDWSTSRPTSMQPITNNNNVLYDYNTGKDIVYMESTLYGNGTAYSILEKDGVRYLYGARFVTASPLGRFEQSHYSELNIPGINNAKVFAFHSTLPYMFYADGSKLYQYDIVNRSVKLMKEFDKESITALKFNIFQFTTTPEYLKSKQFELIVGTKVNAEPDFSNGILRFFEVPSLNGDLIQTQEFKGFAHIVDVTYKEVPMR